MITIKWMTQEPYWKHLKKCVVEFAVFTYEGEIFPGEGLPINKYGATGTGNAKVIQYVEMATTRRSVCIRMMRSAWWRKPTSHSTTCIGISMVQSVWLHKSTDT